MDEESATTVTCPVFAERYVGVIQLIMYVWMCGKVHLVEKQLKLFCAFPLALCLCCGDLEY